MAASLSAQHMYCVCECVRSIRVVVEGMRPWGLLGRRYDREVDVDAVVSSGRARLLLGARVRSWIRDALTLLQVRRMI